jgi:hypothetical protein
MKSILKNIKTTLMGSIAGLPIMYDGFISHNILHIIAGFGTFLVGLFAKDHNTID